MTKEERIKCASRLLQEAGVDFKIGSVSYENTSLGNASKKIRQLKDVISKLSKKSDRYANRLADACVELRELKEKLANITVSNVDAQALKSAESALVYKDEVIDDISKELAATKKELRKYQSKHKVSTFKPYPTEDNPAEIDIKDALRFIRKAMREGHTVVVDY